MWGLGDWGAFFWGGSGVVPGVAVPIDPLFSLLLGIGLGACAVHSLSSRTARFTLGSLLMVPFAMAIAITPPNTFKNGTIADADEVNDNFATLADNASQLEARIAQLESALVITDDSVTLTGTNVAIDATGTATIEGSQVRVTAAALLDQRGGLILLNGGNGGPNARAGDPVSVNCTITNPLAGSVTCTGVIAGGNPTTLN